MDALKTNLNVLDYKKRKKMMKKTKRLHNIGFPQTRHYVLFVENLYYVSLVPLYKESGLTPLTRVIFLVGGYSVEV